MAKGPRSHGGTAPLLSVIVPVYNERRTVEDVVDRLRSLPLDLEVVLVDDASTDGTAEILDRLARAPAPPTIRLFRHATNQGKGAAIRYGFAEARGRYVLVQDADLEYDPREYPRLIEPLERGDADVVFGSRFVNGANDVRRRYRWANWLLTRWSNLLTGQRLTDVWTCYKVFPRTLLARLELREDGFGVEAELAAKAAKQGWRIAEVPITYRPRTVREGKKIRARHGLHGLWATLRHNWFS